MLAVVSCAVIAGGAVAHSTVALLSGEIVAAATMVLTVLLVSCAPDDARGVCGDPSPEADHKESMP